VDGKVILILVVFAASAAAAGIFSWRTRQKREQELAELAFRLNLTFRAARNEALVTGWGFLSRLSQGDDRYAFNVLQGHYRDQRLIVFDLHYRTGSGKSRKNHYGTFFILVMREAFPRLTIAPEDILSRIAQAFGYEDINFESAEFSRAFCVRSVDKKFAYDVCNAQMIEYLLANRDLNLEIQGPALTLWFGRQLPAGAIEFNLNRLVDLRERVPAYLFTAA